MTISYKLWKGPFDTTAKVVIKTDGNSKTSIPFDDSNIDYIDWKEWDAQSGNTTEAAD